MERVSPDEMLKMVIDLDPFSSLDELLAKIKMAYQSELNIANIMVLKQSNEELLTLYSSMAEQVEPRWCLCPTVESAFEKGILSSYEQPLPSDWLSLQTRFGHMMFVAVHTSEEKGLFVLFREHEKPLSSDHHRMLLASSSLFNCTFSWLLAEHQSNQIITQKTVALSESQARFQAYVELASDWFWEIDNNLEFSYLSLSELDKGRHSFSNFFGQSPMAIRSDRERNQHKKWQYFQHMIAQRIAIHDFEFEVLNEKNQAVWVSISGKPKFDKSNEFAGYIGIGKDISIAKQREQELNKAKEKAEHANEAKSHFLAVMSHEIRTPMNAILGILELLEDTEPSNEQTELIDFMRGSAQLLQGVISDTLDFAKIESGTLTLESSVINLHRLIKNLVQQFETQAVKKGIYFRYILGAGVPEYIVCDGVRLSQVLLNLLGNAFKFTIKGDVFLSVNRSDTELLISVKDSGVGIAEDKIETLFEPFSQLHDKMVGRQQGVGLGLSITKKLLELMKGRIECTSVVNQGTEFNVSIPLKVVKNVHSPQPETNTTDVRDGFKILVAEDNQANQFIIKAILEKRNHQVTLVENGEQAVESATTELFDIILMDMVMPIMDGVSAAEVIIDELGDSAPPIIALTANAGLSDKNKCLNAGMKDVLTKPLNSSLLDDKIAFIINKKVK